MYQGDKERETTGHNAYWTHRWTHAGVLRTNAARTATSKGPQVRSAETARKTPRVKAIAVGLANGPFISCNEQAVRGRSSLIRGGIGAPADDRDENRYFERADSSGRANDHPTHKSMPYKTSQRITWTSSKAQMLWSSLRRRRIVRNTDPQPFQGIS
jgi:hypothetical protein